MLQTRRRAVAKPLQAKSKVHSFPAPVRGWVSNESLAAAKPGGAKVLINGFPLQYSVRLRGGLTQHARAHATNPVTALLGYESGTAGNLFATTAAAIYDITSPADPNTVPTAAISGQTSGDYSYVNFANTGGQYMVVVNGADPRQIFDGTSWSTSPAITGGPGTNGSAFSHVWLHKKRLWFIRKNTMSAWYLDTDALGGAATEYPLGSLFKKGGALLFGATWSADAGDGLDDFQMFVTTEGEVAVYQGQDVVFTDWTLHGVYECGEPLSKNAIMKAGGDLLVATKDGLVPISSAVKRDRAALAMDAVSLPIEPDWRDYARLRPGNWSIAKWPEKNLAFISLPQASGIDTDNLVVNLKTGAWGLYRGWSTSCCIVFGGALYVGLTTGEVCLAESGGQDITQPYYFLYAGLHENLGSVAAMKVAQMVRATFRHTTAFNANVAVTFNYVVEPGSYPAAASGESTNLWDVGLWDVAVWDATEAEQITTDWVSAFGQGFTLAPMVQITSGNATTPDVELVSEDLLYTIGDIVVA